MKDWIWFTVWFAGMATAPHTLALLGNLTGLYQWALTPLLISAVAAYALNSNSLAILIEHSGSHYDEMDGLSQVIGPYAAALSLTAGRMITAVTLSTVLLVTAGFSFNETLVYWFPNFGFAFLLLAAVLAAQLGGSRTSRAFQLVTSVLALMGVLWLVVSGLKTFSGNMITTTHPYDSEMTAHSLFSVVLIFVGFDAALNHRSFNNAVMTRSMLAALGTLGAMLALWATVSTLYVPGEKLVDSFIPHIITAKTVSGQTGRIIMAVVVIAASCAAVNAMFANVSRSFRRMTQPLSKFGSADRLVRHPAAMAFICGLCVAVMMVAGVAGTDAIDVYVRAGLYSWIFCYGILHLGAVILIRRNPASKKPMRQMVPIIGMILMFISVGVLIMTDPDQDILLRFWLASWAMLALLIYVIQRWAKSNMR